MTEMYISYDILYKKRGDDAWYVASFDQTEDIEEAYVLARGFLDGSIHPKAAGKPSIAEVKIVQSTTVATDIWRDKE